jgi:ribosome-associated protein
MNDEQFDFDDSDDWVSKTQLKKQSQELKELGEKLIELSPASLAQIPLDDELLDAIKHAQTINRKKEGFRRQIQFVGKLIRSRDPAPIQLALDRIKGLHTDANKRFHKLEILRDKILSGSNEVAHDICQQYQSLDLQKIRQLQRQAKKQAEKEQTPTAARQLFQYLKQQGVE